MYRLREVSGCAAITARGRPVFSGWDVATLPATRRIGKVRYVIVIQAESFEDVDNVELPAPPQPGDPIETKIGRCIITSTESMPAESEYAGKIICHLP